MSRLHLSLILSSPHSGQAARGLGATLSALLLLAACGGGGGDPIGRPLAPEAITLTSLDPMYSVQGNAGPSQAQAGPALILGSSQSGTGGTYAVFSFDLSLLPIGAQVVSAELRMPVTKTLNDPGLLDFVPPCSLDHDGRDTHLLEPDQFFSVDLEFADMGLATFGAPEAQAGKPPQWSAQVDAVIKDDATAGRPYAMFRVTVDPDFFPTDVWFVDYEIGGLWTYNGILYPPSLSITYDLP